jgi:DivIVA domain-containing protein
MNSGKGQRDEPKATEHEQEHGFSEPRHYVPAEILNVSFPTAVRGYDRTAVDAHIERVNRLIAEIKVSASPRAAVRHALEQTEQQVTGLLEQARETADELTASARQEAETEAYGIRAKAADLLVNVNAEADEIKTKAEALLAEARTEAESLVANARAEAEDILLRSRLEAENTAQRSQAEADERRRQLEAELMSLRDQTEARMRELQTDTSAVWEQRRQLLEDIREMASRLVGVADAATAREPDEPDLLQALAPQTGAGARPQTSKRDGDEPTPAVEADGASNSESREALETAAGSGESKHAKRARRQQS